MTNRPTKYDDVIDSRDVIEAIEELQGEIEAKTHESDDEADVEEVAELQAELDALLKLQEQAEWASDWRHGEQLIRDSYFAEYAEELADDCGMVDRKLASQWPYTCIDWERAARDLRMDYSSVEFDGETYWIRG